MENIQDRFEFLYLGLVLIFIGTMFLFKKYEPNNTGGLWLGAFWLFIGTILTSTYINLIWK